MPSAAPEGHVGFVCKKRRRDECGSLGAFQGIAVATAPLDDDVFERANSRHHNSSSSSSNNSSSNNNHRKILPASKRLRLDDDRKQVHRPLSERISPTSMATSNSTSTSTFNPPPSTAPCHICHRRPRRRCDLDSLADCEGCGQRTCFVCLRECLGATTTAQTGRRPAGADGFDVGRETSPAASPPAWSRGCSGHRRMICSRCCVERGQDGEVVCLGCLPFVEG